MNEQLTATAQRCLDAAYEGTMDFPRIVRTLIEAGFEGYDVDYRRRTSTYFRASGESVQLALPTSGEPVAAEFHANEVEQAVREAQNKAPGYTYAGFCAKVKAAGCAGYMVSFLGRRVVYFGRTAETHVEHFPR
jgi:uncharacterized protein YbcV (DUF1398 family)